MTALFSWSIIGSSSPETTTQVPSELMPQMDRPANGRELNAQSGAAADADDHGFYTFIRSARRF